MSEQNTGDAPRPRRQRNVIIADPKNVTIMWSGFVLSGIVDAADIVPELTEDER